MCGTGSCLAVGIMIADLLALRDRAVARLNMERPMA